MKSFLILFPICVILFAALFTLVIGGLLQNGKRVWHRCIWCKSYFDDIGNIQSEVPRAEVKEWCDRCQDCREAAEKQASILLEMKKGFGIGLEPCIDCGGITDRFYGRKRI